MQFERQYRGIAPGTERLIERTERRGEKVEYAGLQRDEAAFHNIFG